jgi:pSer/pThr/pTyr-binding forkhead associated (FHA) protein
LAFLIVKRGAAEDIDKIFKLDKPVTAIGRCTLQYKPDVGLYDDVVSRRHAEIVLNDGKFWIRDLDSTNGTMLNEDRIISGNLYELKHNSRIGLGVEGMEARIILQFKETEDTSIINQRNKASGKIPVSWLKVDSRKKDVLIDGKQQKLSRKEYELLMFLYENAGNVCSRDEIIESVWSDSKDPTAISDANIDQLVHRLREKVEPDPSNPTRIISKKAFGYMLI